MSVPDIARDRSGRLPRASRSQTFYQALDYSGPARPEVDEMLAAGPVLPPQGQTNPVTQDIARGNGY